MAKINIVYCDNTLNVTVEGQINSNYILQLKRKVFYIVKEYGIGKILIDVSKKTDIDGEAFYDFLNEYNNIYGGVLKVVE